MYQAGLAKIQFVSTYLKGPIGQWGPRRGVCAKSSDYIDVFCCFLFCFISYLQTGFSRGGENLLTGKFTVALYLLTGKFTLALCLLASR